jgi:hypothetical protein
MFDNATWPNAKFEAQVESDFGILIRILLKAPGTTKTSFL